MNWSPLSTVSTLVFKMNSIVDGMEVRKSWKQNYISMLQSPGKSSFDGAAVDGIYNSKGVLHLFVRLFCNSQIFWVQELVGLCWMRGAIMDEKFCKNITNFECSEFSL